MTTTLLSFGKPTVVLIAEPDDLSLSLVKTIIEKNCKVFLVSNNKNAWEIILPEFSQKKIELIKKGEIKNIERIDYLIYHYNFFCATSNKPARSKEHIKSFIKSLGKELLKVKSKNLFLVPALEGLYFENLPIQGKTIYFSETIGPGMVFAKGFATFDIFDNLRKGVFYSPKNQGTVRPISSQDAANKILEILFSFSHPYEVTILGEEYSPEQIVEEVKKEKPAIASKKSKYYKFPKYFSAGEEIVLGKVSGWAVARDTVVGEKEKEPKNDKSNKRLLSNIVIVLIFLLILPFFLTALSLAGMATSYKFVKAGKFQLAKDMAVAASSIATFSEKELMILIGIPFAGKIFLPFRQTSEILERTSSLGVRGITAFEDLEDLFRNIIGDKSYNISSRSEKIALELEYIYKESGFILGEVETNSVISPLVKKNNTKTFLEKRETLLYLSQVFHNLPQSFGENGKKKYLVLLQNNMELRPTGGYIGSFALVTFEGGRMSDLAVWDVFEADGQLKGHVEPPPAIKLYLDEGGWFLRDSNWDPDFRVSAQRAEWFLDKEIDEKVDGVMALDLELVKNLLVLTGPVHLGDFDKNIDSNNLFETLQNEIENNFFPGSTKKANLLTGLTRELNEKIKDLRPGKKFALGKILYQGLEEKHLQVYLHDEGLQNALSHLGWDGGVDKGSLCGQNCFSDYLGIVEANLGVNKANLYIERKISASVILGEKGIQKKVVLEIKNNATKDLGLKGRYKAYVRILAPQGSFFNDVELVVGDRSTKLFPEISPVRDHIEAGVLVIIDPQEIGSLTFSWVTSANLNFKEKGEYDLLVRKQAGTRVDPLTINIFSPKNLNVIAKPEFSLTSGGISSYNTSLARDFVSRINW